MTETPETTAEKSPKTRPAPAPNYSRKTLRKKGREKRKQRLQQDQEFAKAYFEGKSKRSDARKLAFRKRHKKTEATA